MRATFTRITVTALVFRLGAIYGMDNFQQGSILPEVRSLLEVISRLAPVDSVVDNSAEDELPISVCFRDSQSFRPFKLVLSRFRGNFRWVPMAHLPYVCVVPLITDGGSATSDDETRALVIQDLGSLARYVEGELHLEGVPPQGVFVTQRKKHVRDVGPGGPALLVADPHEYVTNGFVPTSKRDKTVEYWMSDEEGDLIYDKLHASHGTASGLRDMALLKRVSESKHGDLIILASEVHSLKEECQRMADGSPDLRAAMTRVARVCDLALADGLGIVVLGR